MPGYGFGYGYGAVGFARRNPRLGEGTPTPSTGPALPAQTDIVGHFDSSAIPPQSDNSALVQWDDMSSSAAHATQATAARQPRYRAAAGAGINGQPYVQCDGVDDFLAIATPGALTTALDSRNYTIMVVVDNVADGAGGFGNIFGATAGGDGLTVSATATACGQGANSMRGRMLDPSGTGYRSFGIGSTSTSSFGGSNGGNVRRYFYRGTVFGSSVSEGIVTGGKTIAIGAGNVDATPTFRFKGNIYRIIIWSKLLSPAEALQAETYFNWFYGQVHPAVTHGRFLHIDGDSRFAAVGAGSGLEAPVHYRIAQGLGFPPGTYSVYAIGGLSIQKCINKGAEVDDVAQALTRVSPAMQHRLIYEEFFNSRTIGTAALTSQPTEYVAARRAGFPEAARIVGCSPVDHADSNTPSASAWGTAIEANWASMGFDGIAKLWSESALGGDTACPNSSPYAPWSDGIHLGDEGQAIQASKIALDAAAVAGW